MKRITLNIVCFCGSIIALISSCRKDELNNGTSKRGEVFAGSTYEYLKSKPGVFDSLLYVVDRLKLDSALKHDSVTLFAVTNASFKLASDDLNSQRIGAGKKPVYLRDYDYSQLDSLMCRYIIKGRFSTDRLNTLNGVTVFGYRYGYELNAQSKASSAMGQVGAGPSSIIYSSKNRSIYKFNWTTSIAYSVNVPTSNGLVHIIDDKYYFGFGYYSKQPSSPYLGVPFELPVQINVDSAPLEAENYDIGGVNVAYYDSKGPHNEGDGRFWNNGGQYRNDGVDIYAQSAYFNKNIFYKAGFKIGSMAKGEWMNYSINVPADGNYKIKLRYSVANTLGSPSALCDLRLDWKLIATSFKLPPSALMDEISAGTFFLTKGRHYFTFCTGTSVPDLNLDSFVFQRVN